MRMFIIMSNVMSITMSGGGGLWVVGPQHLSYCCYGEETSEDWRKVFVAAATFSQNVKRTAVERIMTSSSRGQIRVQVEWSGSLIILFFWHSCFLTVSLWSIFQAERERERGVLLKKLCGEGVPPQTVTFLVEDKRDQTSAQDSRHFLPGIVSVYR